jgi:hypothetical protein
MKLIQAQTMLLAAVFLTGCAGEKKHVRMGSMYMRVQPEPEEAEAASLPPPSYEYWKPTYQAPSRPQEPMTVYGWPSTPATPDAEGRPEPETQPEPTPLPVPESQTEKENRSDAEKTTATDQGTAPPPQPPVTAALPTPAQETGTQKQREFVWFLVALLPAIAIGAWLLWNGEETGAKT